jgi:hypothetical protein
VLKLFVKIAPTQLFFRFYVTSLAANSILAKNSGCNPIIFRILRTLLLEKTLNKVHILSLASIIRIESDIFRLCLNSVLT